MSETDAGRDLTDGGASVLGPLVVTEAELAVLEAAHLRLLGEPRPRALCRDEAQPGTAEGEAWMSLAARGLLDERGELREEGDLGLVVSTVLDVRLGAHATLVVERMVLGRGTEVAGRPCPDGAQPEPEPARHGLRLVHLIGSAACVEDLIPDGSHHLYLLLSLQDAVRAVTDATVPPGARAGSGRPRVVRTDLPEQMRTLLEHPTVLVDLAAVTPSLPDEGSGAPAGPVDARSAHHLVAMGPSGCWVADIDREGPVPATVVFSPIDPGWVERWVRSVMEGSAPSAGGPVAGGGQGTMSG